MTHHRTILTTLMLMLGFVCPVISHSADRAIDSLSRQSVESLFNAGREAFDASDFDHAMRIFSAMSPMYDEDGTREEQLMFAASFNYYGNLLYKKGAYASAMDYYLKGRRIAERYGDDNLLADIFGNIGNIYAASTDYQSAIDFFRRALSLSRGSRDYSLRSMLINNLFAANYLSGQQDSARYYCRMLEMIPPAERTPRYLYDIYLSKGMIAESNGKNDSAALYYRKAARYSIEQKLAPMCEGAAYSCLAQHYENVGRLDSALFYLHASEKVARDHASYRMQVDALRDLARVYDKAGQTDLAMEYKSRYLNLSDSLSFQEDFNRLKNSQMIYELDLSAGTIRRLNADKALQRQWLLVAGGALLVFGLFTFALVWQKNKLKKVCADLYERNDRQLNDELLYKSKIKDLEQSLAGMVAAMPGARSGEMDAAEDEAEKGEADTHDTSSGRRLVSSQRQREKIVRDILDIMENTEDYCSPEFSLEKLASSIGSNPRYVSEVLNDEFKKNFRTILNEYRIKKAMLRLSDTPNYGHLTIKAISESVGYKSQSTFISVFTKFTGLKPSLYQKLAIEKGS